MKRDRVQKSFQKCIYCALWEVLQQKSLTENMPFAVVLKTNSVMNRGATTAVERGMTIGIIYLSCLYVLKHCEHLKSLRQIFTKITAVKFGTEMNAPYFGTKRLYRSSRSL